MKTLEELLFVARGEQKEGNNIDVRVKFHKNAALFDFVKLSYVFAGKIRC